MLSSWQNHLLASGAVIENHRVGHFGNPAAEMRAAKNGTVLADLSHLGLIAFSGEDSQAFLHSQLSSDVNGVTLSTAQYSSVCTAKGRMLASFLLWQSDRGYFIQLPGEIRENAQKQIGKFVLRSKVKISDASDVHVCLGVAGDSAEELLEKHFVDIPTTALGVAHEELGTLIALSPTRYEIVTAPEKAPALWAALSHDATPVGSVCWQWLDIRSGIPSISPATLEQFVPQMANMELIGGISFDKGCYPGQEIVARMQHRGTLKRRMYLANINSATPPAAGDELFGSDLEGQASGMIVNAAASPDGGYDVLAVLQISSVKAGEIHWKSPDGATLKFIPLPYQV